MEVELHRKALQLCYKFSSLGSLETNSTQRTKIYLLRKKVYSLFIDFFSLSHSTYHGSENWVNTDKQRK